VVGYRHTVRGLERRLGTGDVDLPQPALCPTRQPLVAGALARGTVKLAIAFVAKRNPAPAPSQCWIVAIALVGYATCRRAKQ
jgi:hypothetical protein